MSEYSFQRIIPNRGPTLEFNGKIIGEMTTFEDGKASWNEDTLWETPASKWILEVRKCSDHVGHEDMVDVYVFEQADDLERKIAVLDALKWVYPAQDWAKRMGWKLVKRID